MTEDKIDYRKCNECTEKYCVCERTETEYSGKAEEIARIAFKNSLESKFNPEVAC